MRALSFTLGFLFLSGVAVAAPKYPFVSDLQGKVRWTDKDKKDGKLKNKQVLIEQASLETDAKSQVVVFHSDFVLGGGILGRFRVEFLDGATRAGRKKQQILCV